MSERGNQTYAGIWADGYAAGVDDGVSCEHRFGRTSRILWKLTGQRMIAPWDKGDCTLYRTNNPHEPEETE